MSKYLLIPLCFIAILYSSCTQNDIQEQPAPVVDRWEDKHIPSDEFFMQRSYPDNKFSIKAFEKGLQEAKHFASSRSIPYGFEREWEVQGPGNIGARVNTVAIDPNNEDIIYAGFAGGGIFKTEDGGENWVPIFDEQLFLNIGVIVIDPNDSETIYVGTGDPNISGYPKIGNGVFRSTDGGDSWENIGLVDQRIISKIIVHPFEPNTILVSAMGLPFERNNDRGIYKTLDGGDNWDQVLFLSDSTGVIDMVMDPSNPDILFASGWDRIRNNRESIVRGFGAKVYKSDNGGDTWDLVEGGLPNDVPHSRVGLAIAPSNPNVVYAQYVSPQGFQLEAIYRSNDKGLTWNTIPIDEDDNDLSSNAMGGFGWYFGKIRVNPLDENDLFLLGVDLWRTKNAGLNWEMATPTWSSYIVHADKHDLVMLPSADIILATDGGVYRSDISAQVWEDIENIPTTQFYRVGYNPHEPNLYYGGAQDNGTTGGNKENINEWDRIWGGDGFQIAFDTENPERFFVETQRGNINVFLNGAVMGADYGIPSDDPRNWDMPYMISYHDNNFLYAGTNKVYVGIGEVPEWSAVSEDLTDDPPGQHRYHNITAIDESPITRYLIYAGTGDGNVWRGEEFTDWTNITGNLPDQYVTDVIASPTDVNTVYVTHSGYRDNDDLARIHRSTDQGETWEDISSDLPELAINELLVLPEHEDSILFVATDGGVYGTTDSGESWNRLGTNMPFIFVFDMVWNAAKNELVAGTFARSIMTYPLDSIGVMPMDSIVTTNNTVVPKISPLKIYPTLASDLVKVEVINIEPGRDFELAVLDASGKLIHTDKINSQQALIELDVKNWAPGHYFVKVKMRHEVVTERFVKH